MKLTIDDLQKKYNKKTVLDIPSMTLEEKIYGLIGCNGAGKTTLMNILCGMLKPDSGSVKYDGEDIFSLDGKYRRLIGYVPQDSMFYDQFTVMDFVIYVLLLKGGNPKDSGTLAYIDELLELFNLTEQKNKKISKLSGGMKRRVMLVQALLEDPRILFLDEPSVGLDPSERINMKNHISKISVGRIVLISTHITSDLEYLADELILIKDGRIVRKGDTSMLLKEVSQHILTARCPASRINEYSAQYRISKIRYEGDECIFNFFNDGNADLDDIVLQDYKSYADMEDLYAYYLFEAPAKA